MYVYVVRTCIRCGTNMYLGGTQMGGTKTRWYEKTSNHAIDMCTSHFDFTPRGIQHKRFLKYSNYDASYQLELYVISCGDVHPNPGPTRRNGNNDNNNNPPLQSQEQRTISIFANARSIVNKIAKLQTEIASNSFDIIVLTETHLDSSIPDAKIFGSEYCSYRKDQQQVGHFGGSVLIASRRWIEASLREGLAYESELLLSIYQRRTTRK